MGASEEERDEGIRDLVDMLLRKMDKDGDHLFPSRIIKSLLRKTSFFSKPWAHPCPTARMSRSFWLQQKSCLASESHQPPPNWSGIRSPACCLACKPRQNLEITRVL